MKTQFRQTLAAIVIPVSFIGILFLLNTMPLSKYGFGGIIVTFIAILITYIALKKDKRTFKDIGFQWERKTPIRFTIGFFVGFFIAVLMLMVVLNFTNLEFIYNTNINVPSALFWLVVFFPLAFMEEIIFLRLCLYKD